MILVDRLGQRPWALLVLLLACGEGPTEVPTPEIAGHWVLTEDWGNTSLGISCLNSGTIDIEQNATTLTGMLSQEGTCTDRSGDTFPVSASGTLRAGQISGDRAGFTAANCNYQGTISGNPPDFIGGVVGCLLSVSGQTNLRFNGTWTATR